MVSNSESRDGEKSHDEVLKKSGGYSWLALRATSILIPAKVSGDLIVNIAAFYQLIPQYHCTNGEGGDWYECTPEAFCGEDSQVIEYREDTEHPESFNNWIQQLNMQCYDKSAFSLLGTMIFSGWVVAAFFVPRISDLYGRKITFIVNMAVQSVAIVAMIVAKSYITMAVALFIVGLCSSARWTVSYVYLMEFLTEDTIKCVGPFVNASAALAFVIAAFTLQVLTKETVVLEYAALTISTLSVILTALFLPESPKWLVNSD